MQDLKIGFLWLKNKSIDASISLRTTLSLAQTKNCIVNVFQTLFVVTENSQRGGRRGGAIIFPPEVQAAKETVLGSSDELDRPDMNVVQYINKLFPTEQSLAGLDDTMGEFQAQVGGRKM